MFKQGLQLLQLTIFPHFSMLFSNNPVHLVLLNAKLTLLLGGGGGAEEVVQRRWCRGGGGAEEVVPSSLLTLVEGVLKVLQGAGEAEGGLVFLHQLVQVYPGEEV